MEKRKMDLRVVKYFLLATLLVLIIRYFDVLMGGAGNLWSIIWPLILGGVIAYVLNIVMRKLEKIYFPDSKNAVVKKSRRPVCIVLSLVLITAVFFLILQLVVPELGKAFVMIGQSIPVLFDQAVDWLAVNADTFPQTAEELQNLQIDWNSLGDSVWNYLKAGVGGFLNSTVTIVGSVVGFVINFVISLIFALYILSSKEKLANQAKRTIRAYVRPDWIARCRRILLTADETFSRDRKSVV